jgi:hypothetical protein
MPVIDFSEEQAKRATFPGTFGDFLAQLTGNRHRVPPATHVCTHDELAALEFEAIEQFAIQNGQAGNKATCDEMEKFLHNICIATRLSMAILSQTKAALIDGVGKTGDAGIAAAECLQAARENAEVLARFIRVAELRQACAVSNCYDEAGNAQS